jgi:uncharacterized protein with GYD domain
MDASAGRQAQPMRSSRPSRRRRHAEISHPGGLYRRRFEGLHKDKASGRAEAVGNAVTALGGKVESMHYAFGEDDVVVIVDVPDNVSVAALSLTVSASGMVRSRVTPLLTLAEVDQAPQKKITYRAPGR